MSRNRDVSRYVIVVDNISSSTPTKDVEHEMAAAGRIRDIVRDHKLRLALVEYERSDDAKWAWSKLDGLSMDGRRWKVEFASYQDFKLFGWKWFEGGRSPSPYRSSRGRSRSRSPPITPHDNKDHRRGNSQSEAASARSRSATPSARHDER